MSTPIEKTLLVKSCAEEAVLLFGDRDFTVNLIVLPFDEFDVILGMDKLK